MCIRTIIPEAEAGANTTAITEGQATVTAEQSQIREQEAEASEPTSDSSTDNSSSSSDSDSDTDDNRSDRTTCYKRRPRGRTTDTPTAGTVAADAEPAQPISEADHTGVPDTCDNMLLREAIKQLTQEMGTMRQEWKTVSETQQGLVQELKETNKQLQEVNEYYRYLLELEHRKQVATTGPHGAVSYSCAKEEDPETGRIIWPGKAQCPITSYYYSRLLNAAAYDIR